MHEIEMGGTSSYGQSAPLKNRIAAIALAIAIELLVVIAMLTIGRSPASRPDPSKPVTVLTLSGDQPKAKRTTTHHAAAHVAKVKPPPPPQSPIAPKTPSAFVVLSKKDFAAADIGKLPTRLADTSTADASGSTSGPGEGPGGAHLYNAAWYREPKPGELAYYLPKGAPPDSWATIACRTVEHYHVEDCTALAESPPGSGLAKALRLASWQFLIRPPSRDGRPLIGTWVRIRFDWTERDTK